MRRLNFFAITLLVAGLLAGCKKDEETGPEEGSFAGTTLYIYSNEGGNFDIYALNPGDGTTQKVIGTSADEKQPFYHNGKIYFAANDNGDYAIYVANGDGSGRTKITDYPGDEFQPVVSPNGRHLAFTWGSSGNYRVVLYDLQAGDSVKSFGASGTNESPHFVGNDTLIMTLQDYAGAYSQDPWIYVISADTLIHPYSLSSTQEAYWRVKGGKVAFSQMGLYGEDTRITLADFPTFNNLNAIYHHGNRPINPVWSPDGNYLAVGHAGICLIVALNLNGDVVDTLYRKDGAVCAPFSWK